MRKNHKVDLLYNLLRLCLQESLQVALQRDIALLAEWFTARANIAICIHLYQSTSLQDTHRAHIIWYW